MPVDEGCNSPPTVAAARRCAYAVLRRVFEDDAWADRALRGEAERLGLDARDLGLATAWPTAPSSAGPRSTM